MSDPVLELESLAVRYGPVVALRGLTARFQGGALALLGPNGAGKSSLLRAVLGLVPPASGRIRVFGADAAGAGRLLRRRVGYAPERDSYLVGVSGVAAAAHLGEICGLRRADALSRAHDVLHFVGMGEERYREVATYSVGMRQRWKLAAALVHSPDVLFLDEPTNGLDPQGRVRMLELIGQVVREHGVHLILASHLLPDVEKVCDQVWVLDRGELRLADSIQNLTAAARGAKRVRVAEGQRAAFAAAAAGAGFTLHPGGEDEVLVSLPDGVVEPRQVFDVARQAGAAVLGVKPAARSLEDAYLESLEREG